ncbi:MAG: hypothetical protein ABH858_06265 [Candidatus Omnitrophota bacterium]
MLTQHIKINTHYEEIAVWMDENIPAGETIYHVYWSDSPYFICLNPKNNYMVVLDPIYMFYRYPEQYLAYNDLKEGLIKNPYIIKKIFDAAYGYSRKETPLYSQIRDDKEHFDILYEDDYGIVFKIRNDESTKG